MRELSSFDLQTISGGLDTTGAVLYAFALIGSRIGYETITSVQPAQGHGTPYGVLGAMIIGGLITHPLRTPPVIAFGDGVLVNACVGFLGGAIVGAVEDTVTARVLPYMQKN